MSHQKLTPATRSESMESFNIDGQVDSSPFTVIKGDLCKKARRTDNVMVAQFTNIDFLQAGQADGPHIKAVNISPPLPAFSHPKVGSSGVQGSLKERN